MTFKILINKYVAANSLIRINIITLEDIASKNKIGMALINSNEGKRDGVDSFEAMKKRSTDQQYKAPYLLDKNNLLADQFGASTTPHIFLFDKDMKLAYKGA